MKKTAGVTLVMLIVIVVSVWIVHAGGAVTGQVVHSAPSRFQGFMRGLVVGQVW